MVRVSYATPYWLLMFINFFVPTYLVRLSLLTIYFLTTLLPKPDWLTCLTHRNVFAIR